MSPPTRNQGAFHERLMALLLRIPRKLGVGVELYFTVREPIRVEDVEPADPSLQLGFLGEEDAEPIAAVPHGGSLQQTRKWFEEGRLCFGVRDGSRIVGKMWCDLEAFHFPPEYRRLEPDEAYFFAAAVAPDYKGRNLAPLMRAGISDALRKRGRTRFYSYTEYFNHAARRFKEKLGCRNQALRLHLNLFGRWKRTWTLQRYD